MYISVSGFYSGLKMLPLGDHRSCKTGKFIQQMHLPGGGGGGGGKWSLKRGGL